MTQRAIDAIKASDLNLFVHNIATGELNAEEVSFFHRIKKHWQNPKEVIDRTIFVLSRADEIEDEQIDEAIAKIKEQISEYFLSSANIIAVSSKKLCQRV